MLKKFKSINWNNYTIKTEPTIFSKDLLKTTLTKFWSEIIEVNVSENQHILLLFRLQWSDNQFVTIGNLQRLNLEDKDYFLDFILDEIKNRGDYYLESSIISVVFSYGIRDGRTIEKQFNTKTQFHNYQHHKLPITMNPLEYGKLITQIGNEYIIQINKTNVVKIIQEGITNKVELFRSGILTYIWTDARIDDNTFSRILGRKEFIFKNNELFLFKTEKPVKFISTLNQQKEINNKFITLDIETYIKDGVHTPYCISFYDGLMDYFITLLIIQTVLIWLKIVSKILWLKNMIIIKFIFIIWQALMQYF